MKSETTAEAIERGTLGRWRKITEATYGEGTMKCEAVTLKGTPCTRNARIQHATQIGTRVLVCAQHYGVLTRREEGRSDEEVLAAWARAKDLSGG